MMPLEKTLYIFVVVVLFSVLTRCELRIPRVSEFHGGRTEAARQHGVLIEGQCNGRYIHDGKYYVPLQLTQT